MFSVFPRPLFLALLFVAHISSPSALTLRCNTNGDCLSAEFANAPVLCAALRSPSVPRPLPVVRDAIFSRSSSARQLLTGGAPSSNTSPFPLAPASRFTTLPEATLVPGTTGLYVVDTSVVARLRPDLKCDPGVRKCPSSLPVDYVAVFQRANSNLRSSSCHQYPWLGKVGCETHAYHKRCNMYCP